ncbi:hypothetical protein D3C78_1526990 [compost metagenome]
MGVVKPVVHSLDIHPEGKRSTVNPKFVVLGPVGDGVKCFAHVADLKGVAVISSLRCHMARFGGHRFEKQRRSFKLAGVRGLSVGCGGEASQ